MIILFLFCLYGGVEVTYGIVVLLRSLLVVYLICVGGTFFRPCTVMKANFPMISLY